MGGPLKILVMGRSERRRNEIADALAASLGAVRFAENEIKANIVRNLDNSRPDAVERARRIGWLCDQVIKAGHWVVADGLFDSSEERDAFGEACAVSADDDGVPAIRAPSAGNDCIGMLRERLEEISRRIPPIG
jgi:predicted kinase